MTALEAQKFTDRDLIESILNSYFIVDYGFISKVYDDGLIDVTHARKGVTLEGKVLPEYKTHGVELLVFSCAEFSVNLKPKTGDGVLLLGLKDLVETVKDLTQPATPKAFVHYDRSTIKAVPLSVFNDDAKIKLELEEGNANLTAAGKITLTAGTAAETLGGLLGDLGTILQGLKVVVSGTAGTVDPSTIAQLQQWTQRLATAFD